MHAELIFMTCTISFNNCINRARALIILTYFQGVDTKGKQSKYRVFHVGFDEFRSAIKKLTTNGCISRETLISGSQSAHWAFTEVHSPRRVKALSP